MNNLDLQIVIITIMQLSNLSKAITVWICINFSIPQDFCRKKQQNLSAFLAPEIIPFWWFMSPEVFEMVSLFGPETEEYWVFVNTF